MVGRAPSPGAGAEPRRGGRRRRREPRALPARARGGRPGAGHVPGERSRHGAGAGDAGLLGHVDRARQRLGRPRRGRRPRPGARSSGRGVLHAAAGLARAGSGARVLLRVRERGALAAVPPGGRPPRVPGRGLEPLPAGQPPLRAGGRRRGPRGRPHRPGPGLPLRPAPPDDPRPRPPVDRHHLLAHPLAERRALRHLPLGPAAARGPAGIEHPRLPHAGPLQQLPRVRGPHARGPHRPRAPVGGRGRTRDPGARLSDLGGVAQPLAGAGAVGGGVPQGRPGRARAAPRRPRRTGSGSARLHQGNRRAAPGGRAAAGAPPRPAREVLVRPGGGAEPHPHRTLPPPRRGGGAHHRPHQRAVRGPRAGADRPPPRPSRSAPRSSASTGPPTSATSRASTTA